MRTRDCYTSATSTSGSSPSVAENRIVGILSSVHVIAFEQTDEEIEEFSRDRLRALGAIEQVVRSPIHREFIAVRLCSFGFSRVATVSNEGEGRNCTPYRKGARWNVTMG